MSRRDVKRRYEKFRCGGLRLAHRSTVNIRRCAVFHGGVSLRKLLRRKVVNSETGEKGNGETDTLPILDQPTATSAGQQAQTVEQPGAAAPIALKMPRRRKGLLQIFVAAIALLTGIAGGAYYFRNIAPYESTDDAYIDGHVISISPQVCALVAAIHIDDNQYVHKGDLLVELDPTDYQVALNQARGAEASKKGKLEQARAGVDTAESAVVQARAGVDSAQAMLENADRALKRYQGLSAQARSQQDVDTATANRKTAAASVEQAKAQLQAAQSQVTSAKANVIAADGDYRTAQADTSRAEVNLGYCRIIAAADGRITNKAVDPGAYVTPAGPLFQIVPSNVWVVANFKETQLNYMQAGQPVTITVDAYPGMELRGKVDSIQSGTGSRFSIIPVQNATGNFVKVVQRLPVKIILTAGANDDSTHLLSPGMSVEPKVRVHCTGCWDKFYTFIRENAFFRKAT